MEITIDEPYSPFHDITSEHTMIVVRICVDAPCLYYIEKAYVNALLGTNESTAAYRLSLRLSGESQAWLPYSPTGW